MWEQVKDQFKGIQDAQKRGYEAGVRRKDQATDKLIRELEKGLEAIYKYRYDEDTVGNEAYHLQNIIKQWKGDQDA